MKPLNLNLKKGALHEALGMKPDAKIPVSALDSAKKSTNPLMKKRATFALNAKSWNHSK